MIYSTSSKWIEVSGRKEERISSILGDKWTSKIITMISGGINILWSATWENKLSPKAGDLILNAHLKVYMYANINIHI